MPDDLEAASQKPVTEFGDNPAISDQSTQSPQAARIITMKEMKFLLETATQQLLQTLRTIYIMREIEPLITREAAQSLGITSGNVKVLLHRARDHLKSRRSA